MERFLGIILTLFVSTSYAQQGFHIGAVAGLNTVWITHQDDYGQVGISHVFDYGAAPAIAIGYNFTNSLGIQADFIYSFQGAKYQQSSKSGTLNRVVQLNYFKVPLYFKYTYSRDDLKGVKFFIMAGPEIGFLQSAVIAANFVDVPYIGVDEKYRFESTDVEFVAEAGADIYATQNLFFNLGLRIDYGLVDMNAPAYRIGSTNSPYLSGSNATGGLIVGINYMFGKK